MSIGMRVAVWTLALALGAAGVHAADPAEADAEAAVAAGPAGTGLDPDSRRVRDFGPADAGRDKWRGEDDGELAVAPAPDDPGGDRTRGDSLVLPVAFPRAAAAWRGKRLPGQRFHEWSYTGLVSHRQLAGQPSVITGRLEYDVWLPHDLPAGIRVQSRLALKTKDGLWFEALGMRAVDFPANDPPTRWEPAQALHRGWNRLRVELREEGADFRPRGHGARWSRYLLAQVREIGIVVQGDRAYTGTVAIDNFATWNVDDAFDGPMRVLDLATPPADVRQGDALTWTFRLNRPLLNPFRQRELVADLVVARDGGPDVRIPVFYDQPHVRAVGRDGPPRPYTHNGLALAPTVAAAEPDRYTPVGAAVLRARYRPPAPGDYRWRLEIRYTSPVSGRTEAFGTPEAAFRAAPPRDGAPPMATRGYVRVSTRDPRYFEFNDGTFFFPVGHSFRSPADKRHVSAILQRHYPGAPVPADRGLRVYEEIFPRLQAAGMNVSEVWMATWWLDLEWTPAWTGYHHLQGYNLENAFKMDALLDTAERHGQYIHLTLDNHGKSTRGADSEWVLSPYRKPPAGGGDENDYFYGAAGLYAAPPDLPEDPESWFGNALAKELYRDKLRYVAARWGQHPSIFAWELWSELDLTGNRDRDRNHYAGETVHRWHEEMTAFLRAADPTGRPITTHYSGNHNVVDWKMAAQPFIDYVACDAYTDNEGDNLLAMLGQTEQKVRALDAAKPFMITEFGGGAHGAPQIETLFAHFFGGLWWGWLSTSASTPFNWWYEWIILEDLYRYYGAFTKFIAGEDKRRAADEPQLTNQWPRRVLRAGEGTHPGALASMALADGNVYYALVNNAQAMVWMPRSPADRPKHPGARLRLGAVGPGLHTVEVFDVWTGEVVARTENAEANPAGVLDVDIPPFDTMAAVKIRARKPRARAAIDAADKATPPRPAAEPAKAADNADTF